MEKQIIFESGAAGSRLIWSHTQPNMQLFLFIFFLDWSLLSSAYVCQVRFWFWLFGGALGYDTVIVLKKKIHQKEIIQTKWSQDLIIFRGENSGGNCGWKFLLWHVYSRGTIPGENPKWCISCDLIQFINFVFHSDCFSSVIYYINRKEELSRFDVLVISNCAEKQTSQTVNT